MSTSPVNAVEPFSSNTPTSAISEGREMCVFKGAGHSDDVDTDDVVRLLGSVQTLEPGYYWTALHEAPRDTEAHRHFNVGETLLLVDVIEFEDRPHSVKMRVHPVHGERTFVMMVDDFIKSFEPCPDAESLRQKEQKDIMRRVAEIQDELMRTQMDPQLMIDAVKSDVEAKIAESDKQIERTHSLDANKQVERDKNFEKIHRRATRRSAAKGNPLTVPKATLSLEVGTIIAQGIDATGVSEMSRMAGRQVIIAQAQGNWLQSKTREISKTIESLMPYMSEHAAVAMARSSGALRMAERIKSGIESLDLYTGKGVDVFDVRTGKAAASSEPLALIQGKRFMDEELAVWADVSSTFDSAGKETFFKALAENDDLLNQVFPTPRCVVTMAVLRRPVDYGDALANIMRNQQNQLVFLLVRNGENVHVVYSSTPSHEAASRLFPTQKELEAPFNGWDGSKVSIRDIEFGKAAAEFDDIALCYKRFLILLCGLDHRLKLLGDFYPEHEQTQFMTAGFQSRHFNFIADDDASRLIGDGLHPFSEWLTEHNKMLQSGSRAFVLSGGASKHSPEIKRRSTLVMSPGQFTAPFIAVKEGASLNVRIHCKDPYSGDVVNVKCELLGPGNAVSAHDRPWWLCVDAVDIEDVRRYRFSRRQREMGVGYLRLLRRVEAFLVTEMAEQDKSRAYLLDACVQLGGMPASEAGAALTTAVSNWRAARRGEALPGVDDKARLNEVLSLMVPQGRLPGDVQSMVDAYLALNAVNPLMLTRSGKSKLFLYVEPTDADKAPYPNVLSWGWAKRITLDVGKTKLREVSTSLLWLGTVLPASETLIRQWDAANVWLNELAEPVSLRRYARIPALLSDAQACWAPILKAGKGAGIPAAIFEKLMLEISILQAKHRGLKMNLIHIPVAVTDDADGRKLCTVYFQCRAESLIAFYGDQTQSALVLSEYVRRYVNKVTASQRINDMKWRLVSSEKDILLSHDEVSNECNSRTPSWGIKFISVAEKKNSHFSFGDSIKSKNPQYKRVSVNLSFSRAFEELMQFSNKGSKRNFYKDIEDKIVYEMSCFFHSKAEKKNNLSDIRARRFSFDRKAQSNELVWSSQNGRSNANSNFSRALILSAEKK